MVPRELIGKARAWTRRRRPAQRQSARERKNAARTPRPHQGRPGRSGPETQREKISPRTIDPRKIDPAPAPPPEEDKITPVPLARPRERQKYQLRNTPRAPPEYRVYWHRSLGRGPRMQEKGQCWYRIPIPVWPSGCRGHRSHAPRPRDRWLKPTVYL